MWFYARWHSRVHPMSSSIYPPALQSRSRSRSATPAPRSVPIVAEDYLSSTDEFSDDREEETVGEKRSRQCRERVHKSREKGYYFEPMHNKSRRPAA